MAGTVDLRDQEGASGDDDAPRSGSRPAIEFHRVRSGEGNQLRELRLRALHEAPQAFASSLESERSQSRSRWRGLADASDRARDEIVLVVRGDRRWVAMAAGRWFDSGAGVAQLWGLWVEPGARGRGLGGSLVEGIAGWASAQQAAVLRLGVIEPAGTLTAFYERLGFDLNGETRTLSADGAVRAVFLSRPL